jgi:type IV secretory pathway VirB4 component
MFSAANTGNLNADVPWLGFVPGTSIQATQKGHLIVTLRVSGVDPECLSGEEREAITQRFREAIRQFGPKYRFSQTLISSPLDQIFYPSAHPDQVVRAMLTRRHETIRSRRLYQKELYWSFLLESPFIKSLAVSFSVSALADVFIEQEDVRARELLLKVESFQAQVSSLWKTELLDREGVKRFLAQLVRFRPYNRDQQVPSDANLDVWIPNATVTIFPRHIWTDGCYLKAATLRQAPRFFGGVNPDTKREIYGSHAGVFAGLLGIDCGMIATTEWHPLSTVKAKKHINRLQKNFDSKIVSLIESLFANKNETREGMRQDRSAKLNRDELGDALVALDGDDPIGEFSSTVVLYDPDLRRVEDSMPKVFNALRGATVLEEDQGAYDAWISTFPGNHYKGTRSMYAPLSAFSDMAMLWGDDYGKPSNEATPDKQPFAPLETQNHGLHYFAPNHGPVVGLLIFGQQGAGKTTLGNYFLDSFQRLWTKIDGNWVRPKVFVMDMKDSYKANTLQHGGTYRTLSLDDPGEIRRSPFAAPYSKEQVERIARLIKLMLAGNDGFRTTPEQDQIIATEINDKYRQKEYGGLKYARLGNMNLGKRLQERFELWIGKGQYAAFFDHDEDTFQASSWLTCQYSGFSKHTHLLLPLLYWDFQWFDQIVSDPRLARVPKLILADEVHVLMMVSDLIGPWMLEKINTGRSFNLWNCFIMQWATLLEQHQIGATLNAACPVKLFTASENVRAADYQKIFEMSETVAQRIKSLEPRKQSLRYSANGATVLELHLDAISRDIYANDADATARRYEAKSAVNQ